MDRGRERPVFVGVAGGSGSGKTTLVREIVGVLTTVHVAVIAHDSYYRDRSLMSPEERDPINYDHPDALETDLLVQHLHALSHGCSVNVPAYDFATHSRRSDTLTVHPRKVIIVEGILVLAVEALRELMDIKIFVDTDSDIRFIRRLERDITERGRSLAQVIEQYTHTVRPMHLEFVEPSKRFADIVISEGGLDLAAVDSVVARIRTFLPQESLHR